MLKTLFRSNKKLALILIKTQREVFSTLSGDNVSKSRGEGYDFMELREYESGDDIRHIDWIVTAKTLKPFVKLFHRQQELHVVIAPLLSASLHFGTKLLKKDMLIQICALISYGCIKQNDPFESYICSERVFLSTKKTKQIYGVRELAQKIDDFNVLGKTLDYKHITQSLYTQLRQRSMLFLIGDFFDTQNLNINTLSLKHEVVVIIIRERFEEEPLALGEMHITDPQSGKSANISLDRQRLKTYKKNILENDARLYKKLQTAGVRFLKIYTDEDPAEKIIMLMSQI